MTSTFWVVSPSVLTHMVQGKIVKRRRDSGQDRADLVDKKARE